MMMMMMLMLAMVMVMVIIMSIHPRSSPTRSLSISTNLDPVHRGANLDFDCWTHLDFHCGAKLDFHHESNLDIIAEQFWISNIKREMYLCQIVKQMHAPKLSHARFTLCKILLHIVNGHSSSCPKSGLSRRHQKIWFLDKASLYIIPISSQQRSQPRRAGFV